MAGRVPRGRHCAAPRDAVCAGCAEYRPSQRWELRQPRWRLLGTPGRRTRAGVATPAAGWVIGELANSCIRERSRLYSAVSVCSVRAGDCAGGGVDWRGTARRPRIAECAGRSELDYRDWAPPHRCTASIGPRHVAVEAHRTCRVTACPHGARARGRDGVRAQPRRRAPRAVGARATSLFVGGHPQRHAQLCGRRPPRALPPCPS